MTQPPPIIPGAPQTPQPAYYPPQPTPPKPPASGFPTWAFITLVVVAALTAGGCFYGFLTIAGRGSSATNGTSNVSNCTASGGFYHATVTVKNTGTRASSYAVTVEWQSSSGTRLATDVAYVSSLTPGQEAVSESIATGTDRPGETVRCHVTVR